MPTTKTAKKKQADNKSVPSEVLTTDLPAKYAKGHKCTKQCRHSCGDEGGLTDKGQPCKKLAGYGIAGHPTGHRGRRCMLHDDVGQVPKSVAAVFQQLNERQQRFVVAYCGVARYNATRAAELAGFSPNGGGQNALGVIGHRLLRFPAVKTAIEAWFNANAMSSAEVLARFADLATANLGPFVEVKDGKLVWAVTNESWAEHRHWVKAVDIDPETGAITKLVLHDSSMALRELARILRLYSDQPIVNVNLLVSQLTDAELLQRLKESRAAQARLQSGGVVHRAPGLEVHKKGDS